MKIGPSPEWLVKRLEAIGERSINNVADITNYVMHELGQPMHAFDLDKLAENRIVVRRAKAGERYTTLDEVERKLDDTMLAICDAEKPVAVGGVMGGLESSDHESNDQCFSRGRVFQTREYSADIAKTRTHDRSKLPFRARRRYRKSQGCIRPGGGVDPRTCGRRGGRIHRSFIRPARTRGSRLAGHLERRYAFNRTRGRTERMLPHLLMPSASQDRRI